MVIGEVRRDEVERKCGGKVSEVGVAVVAVGLPEKGEPWDAISVAARVSTTGVVILKS